MPLRSIPKQYLPKSLSKKDLEKQKKNIIQSRKLYKKHRFTHRPKVSYKKRKSPHIAKAEKLYGVKSMSELLQAVPGCKHELIEEVISKGEGAYASSGSRPNQSPTSWAIARLASTITGGKSSRVDHMEIEKYCSKKV